MRGALVILIATIAIGVVLYLWDVAVYRKKNKGGDDMNDGASVSCSSPAEGICCGKHMVCEKTGLSPLSDEIIYYDDEELDRFKGREAETYTNDETEEFREVLMTMLPEDVAGWSRSLQLRGIALPLEVRDELLMIVGELRQ